MEFFAHARVPFSVNGLQQFVRIDTLPEWCASVDRVLEHDGDRGSIYCVWGEFRVHREMIRDGVRFTLPGCPNALQWTVTADDIGGGRVVVHLTINRAEHDADFVASMEQFVADFCAGLERHVPEILKAQRDQAAAEKPEGMPWFG